MREVAAALGAVVFASAAAWLHPPVESAADGAAVIVTHFADDRIEESSGLVIAEAARGGRQPITFVTTNDSGDTGRLYVVEAATGETVRDVDWSEAPVDVEALAPAGAGAVWVGDIGDNRSTRETISVARVSLASGDTTTYQLSYPDGAHDAETLLAHPRTQRLYVVTKSLLGGAVYVAPAPLRSDRPNQLRRVTVAERGAIGRLVTDGAFTADGRHVVLRTYTRATVLRVPGWEAIGDIELPTQPQGEALALDRASRIYVSSEGKGQPILRIPAPATVRPSPVATPGEPETGEPETGEPDTDDTDDGAPRSAEPQGGEQGSWTIALGVGVIGMAGAAIGIIRRRRRRGGVS